MLNIDIGLKKGGTDPKGSNEKCAKDLRQEERARLDEGLLNMCRVQHRHTVHKTSIPNTYKTPDRLRETR